MKKILAFLFTVSLFYFVGAQSVLASSNFNVEVRTYLDGSNMNQAAPVMQDKARGSKIQFSSSGISSQYSFAYYAVNDIIKDNLPQNHEFVVRSNMKITAIFHPNNTSANPRHVVVFADSSNKIIEVKYVEDGTDVTEPSVLPDLPLFAKYATTKWLTSNNISSLLNITSNRVYFLQYEEDTTSQYTVTVNGGTGDGSYLYNSVVTATPDAPTEGNVFSHWEDSNGNVLSTKQNYKFTVLGNVSIQAVFAATPENLGAIVSMSDVLNLRAGYVSYKGQIDLPAGYTIVEYGFIFSRSSDVLTLDSLGATIVPSNVHNGQTGEFLRSFPEDTFNSVRAYLIVKNASNLEEIEYSENIEKLLFTTSTYSTGFENINPAKGSYASGDTTSDGVLWNMTDALVGGLSSDKKNGLYSARLQNSGFIQSKNAMIFSNFSFLAARYGTNASAKLFVQVSTDGTNWIDVSDSINAEGILVDQITLTQFNINLLQSTNFMTSGISSSASLFIKISKTGGDRINIDDIVVTKKTFSNLHEVVLNNSTPSLENVMDGQTITNTTPTQSGYSFAGWYTDMALTQSYNASTPVVQSINLYAKWTINQYTITFNSAGGSSIDPITQDYNSAVVSPENPTKEGYTFSGWSQSVPSNMPAENLLLTAQWSINQYTLTFDSNDGSTVSPITQDFGSSVTQPINPTREGYLFQGWFTDDVSFANSYVFSTMPSQNLTLYAKWEEQVGTYFTVSFDSDGGSIVASEQVLDSGFATEPTPPSKTGYTFAGWFDVSDILWDFELDPIRENMTLYANWTINQYTITFNSNEGSSVTAITQDYNTAVSEPSEPTRSGYNFVGWFTDNTTFENEYVFTTIQASSIILYAKWIATLEGTYVLQAPNGQANTSLDGTGVINYGTELGLNETLFTVNVFRGSSSTAVPAINTANNPKGLRLYYHANGSNYIIITVASGYIIESINIAFLNNKTAEDLTDRYQIDNNSPIDLVGLTNVLTVNTGIISLNNQSVKISNASTSNVQVVINSISIVVKKA